MSDDKHDFYANAVNVITSIYDVTLSFQTRSPIAIEAGKAPIFEASGICSVRMSPQHAKSLAALLIKHISDYEIDNKVELPLPPDIKGFWETYVVKKSKT